MVSDGQVNLSILMVKDMGAHAMGYSLSSTVLLNLQNLLSIINIEQEQ